MGLGRRSEEDEALVREIRHAGANKNAPGKGKTLYIVDARPKVYAKRRKESKRNQKRREEKRRTKKIINSCFRSTQRLVLFREVARK